MGTLATIDIGTNTVLLLVARRERDKWVILRDEARISRLGEGLHQAPFFLSQAQERTFAVLKEFRDMAQDDGAQTVQAVGTAAFRKAKNALEFVGRVKKELGIAIEIISGEEEAKLSYLSVKTDFGNVPNLVALDIGGGSTEIISEETSVSLDLGAVVLTERYFRHDPPTPEEVRSVIEKIEGTLEGHAAFEMTIPLNLVGLAGSVTTLSALHQKLPTWDGPRVQGSKLLRSDIDSMIEVFRRTTIGEKSKMIGMVKGREDTILAGTLILQSIMSHLKVDEIIVSDRGLRFGLCVIRGDSDLC